MSTKPLKGTQPDEHILRVEPPLRPFSDAGWRSRPNLYTNRALSAEALAAEQREHSGRLALRGQMVAPGVVSGLEVHLREGPLEPLQEGEELYLELQPGRGVTLRGEDVVLPRTLRIPVARIPAYWEGDNPAGFELGVLASANPVTTQIGLEAAVLVLVPVVSRREDPPDPQDPAEVDPETLALEDQRWVDGCALVLFAWPRQWPKPHRDAEWRNRLAWMLFDYERQRPHSRHAPWEELGVPLALIGFDPPTHVGSPATPLFVDRAAVSRPGGAPRSRKPILKAHGTPLLWQARIQQFSEHLAAFSSQQLNDGTAIESFAFLPPVGILPRHGTFSRSNWRPRFLPASFEVDAVPVPLEQLDAVAMTSASLLPLHTRRHERVRVLVPVPEAHFEPRLLQEEWIGPEFEEAITSAFARLSQWLWRRKDLRGKADVLLTAIEGVKENRFPETDPDKIADEPPVPGTPDPQWKEEAYGTTPDKRVPELEEALSLYGTWAEPQALGGDSLAVSSATSPSGDTLAILTRGYLSESGTFLTLRRIPRDPNTPAPPPESFSHAWARVDFKLLWNGPEPEIAVLALRKRTSSTLERPQVLLMRLKGGAWTPTGEFTFSGLVPEQIKHFTAVSWKPGYIDAFVATVEGVWMCTWVNGVAKGMQFVSKDKSIRQVEALSPEPGRIELLFLGKPASVPGEGYWLHHLSAVHKGDAHLLSPATEGGTLEPLELKSLKGRQLTACISEWKATSRRLDVLVMGDDLVSRGIRHGWYDGSWKFGMELVSATSGDSVVAMSKGDGRVHAFWWDSLEGVSPGRGPLTYRRLENGRWQPAEVLTTQWMYLLSVHGLTRSQPFTVIFEDTTPNVFLASAFGLLRLRKVAESTRRKVKTLGLKRLVEEVDALHKQVVTFVQERSQEVQEELQHVRELMITSSTEASRLAVSATQGSTLVDSPLVSRLDNEDYLTRFSIRLGGLARIRLSDAMEALEQATTLRRNLTASLIDWVRQLLSIKELGLDVTNLFVQGIARVETTGGLRKVTLLVKKLWNKTNLETKSVVRDSYSLRDMVENPGTLTAVLDSLDNEPENIRRALNHSRLRWTESDYFSTSIQHLENTLNLLRTLERRLSTRVGSMDGYKATLARLQTHWSALDKRLGVVNSGLAESRQDAVVAKALLEEEKARVMAVNQRRERILEQHVPYLVYQRPRQCELTMATPSRLLDTGIIKDILPEVFASTAAAPPELLSYVELIRDSPLRWFSLATRLLRGLDRIELIHRTFVRAQVRAVQRLPVQRPVTAGRTTTSLALGLSRLLSAREDLIARHRSTFVYYQPPVIETRTWLELQQTAHAQLSLGDIIDTAHGRSEVSRDAALELEHVSKVATGLYQRFGEVLPTVRLEWAEQMSQYDTPVNLRDLSRLPHWEEIEVTDRRELQMLVDWLFQRVVATEPEAVSLVNDLVRVCMLLASHAPVNELLSGHVTRPTVARVGGTLELAVDPARVRIGMHVVLRSGDQTVQAVVEDLTSSVVRARVLSASSETVHLPEKTSARFADPARGASALIPLMDYGW